MKKMQDLIGVDNSALIAVFAISYVVSMYIQHNDPEINLKRADWIIGFLSSCVGGFIAFKFTAHITENPGEIMFWTIASSVTSPRAFKFLANAKIQDRLINSIFNRITGGKNTNDDV